MLLSLHRQLVASIVAWFVLSVSLSLFNKFLFAASDGQAPRAPPLLATAWHMGMHFVLSTTLLFALPVVAPSTAATLDLDASSWSQRWARLRMPTWRIYFTTLVPCAVATCLDIGLSNLSLSFLPLSSYTLFKSSTPIFVYGVAIAMVRVIINAAVMTHRDWNDGCGV